MTRRMSNRDRIEHLRAEADATAREKAEAKAKKAATGGSSPRKTAGKTAGKTAAPPARVRIVWLVCDPGGKEIERFPYAQEAEARARAEALTASSGRTHFARQADVPAT